MELSELTPELFEKTEFTERRRGGYDIDEVERFLEETGTAVAQLLVRYRQMEERALHAESRLAEAEARVAAAPAAAPATAAAAAPPSAPAAGGMSEAEEIQKATSTLVMAHRTADAAIAEARAEAQGMVSEARAGADRILAEARSEAAAELAAGKKDLLESVARLEARRDALASVMSAFDERLDTYRRELTEVAGSLTSMVEDPMALAARGAVPVPAEAAGYAEDHPTEDHPTEAYDVSAEPEGTWGQGSWSSVIAAEESASTPSVPVPTPAAPASPPTARAEETISLTDEPATGQTNDRFLRELDEAVNESKAQEGDEAMTAFFEGGDEAGRPRFGWRR